MDKTKPTEKRCTRCGNVKPLSKYSVRRKSRDGLSFICKSCAAAASKARRAADPERYLAASRAYLAANREALREKNRLRYANDPDYRARQRVLVAAWMAANPERMAEHSRKKRVRRQAALVGPVDLAILWTGVCGICGQEINPLLAYPDPMSKSVDHITPLARGGSHTQDNLQYTHLVCNLRKGVQIT